jgi:hypothetical protein
MTWWRHAGVSLGLDGHSIIRREKSAEGPLDPDFDLP